MKSSKLFENNIDIFKYIDKYGNTKLSEISEDSLMDFIILVENYYLEFRNSLNLDKNMTIGVEIECEKARTKIIENRLDMMPLNYDWSSKSDASLKEGIEVVSPIMRDEIKYWEDLKNVCKMLKKHASIGPNCGGHVHLGAHIFGKDRDAWLNFIKLWSAYENVAFRFSYGDYYTARRKIINYSKPVAVPLLESYEQATAYNYNYLKIIRSIQRDKLEAVNFLNVNFYNIDSDLIKNTIEFRCPNGTLEPIIWQNNINLFAHMMEYSKKDSFNDDLVTSRNKKNEKRYELEYRDSIFLDQALELCDMIFENNLDKIYFLRQYLKFFQERSYFEKEKGLLKCKSFFKK